MVMVCAGRGAVYTYDGIGSHERTGYSCEVLPAKQTLARVKPKPL